MLVLNPDVGNLLRVVLQPLASTSVFCNHFPGTQAALNAFILYGCKVSAISTDAFWVERFAGDNEILVAENSIDQCIPEEDFHFAFTMPPFKDDGTGLLMRDRSLLFECSKGRDRRECEAHILCVEAMLRSVIYGGYFAAVLPKRWIGKQMKFMRWWASNAAQVAKITLPEEAVFISDDRAVATGPAPGDWALYVWQRPVSKDSPISREATRYRASLKFAELRYSPFVYKIPDLEPDTTEACAKAFRKSDWWANSVQFYRNLIEKNENRPYLGLRNSPKPIAKQKRSCFFEPTPQSEVTLRVVKDDDAMRKVDGAIQVRPGPPVRLHPIDIKGEQALQDIRVAMGTQHTKTGDIWMLDDELSRLPYSDIKESIIKKILEQGATPCILEQDARRLRLQERWLSIQLTPMERIIPVSGADENAVSWEPVYDDIGMQAVHPDILEMWRSRARSMKIDTVTYPFQFENVCYLAAKQSGINGDVMGLGKSRQALLLPLLRCATKTLLVVPTKLIGIWQNEIESVIAPWARMVRRNWQGDIIKTDYQIIEWGEQCAPDRLRTFNLISYDRLKLVPRDGRFFRCPVCGMVAYSARQTNEMVCPGNPRIEDPMDRCSHRVAAWKKYCKDHNLRKHKVSLSTGKKLKWDNKGSAEHEPYSVVDPRPRRPQPQQMDLQDHIFKKMYYIKAGVATDPKTGVRKMRYTPRERKFHVAWTFSDLLRNLFNHIIIDEALYIANVDTKRSQALSHLCARSRWSLSGTPVKGFPQAILNLINWTIDRAALPDYRDYINAYSGGKRRFLDKYSTSVIIEGKPKQIPKITNPELFQAEMSPFIRRNTRNQPNVIKDIPKKQQDHQTIAVDMDPQHRAYYQQWLDKFSEWWQLMKEEEEGRKVPKGELLTKLSYLINASTVPHFMLENVAKQKDADFANWARLIGKYKGPPTAKMTRVWQKIEEIQGHDKAIVFSMRRRNLDLGQRWCQKKGIPSLLVDGRVSLTIQQGTNRSRRQEMIDDFRVSDYVVLWAGLKALAEGMNIPEANWGLFMDYSWDPTDWQQAVGRMIRPQQTKTVNAMFIVHRGTIDEYMAALCLLKARSVAEGIDFMEFDDFSVEMIPDIQQYADSIVDGTEGKLKRKMWLAYDHLKKREEEENGDEEE